LIVRPGDAVDLRQKLLKLLSDRQLAETFGRQGIALAREKYRWPQIIKGLDNLYLTLK
jgi:glycosyltransferase involved in cell wall biosynthesis